MTSKAAMKRGQHLAMAQTAQDAYANPDKPSPHIPTSDMDCAWRIGQWLRADGRKPPLHIRPSLPWTYHVGVDNDIKATFRVHVPWHRSGAVHIIEKSAS